MFILGFIFEYVLCYSAICLLSGRLKGNLKECSSCEIIPFHTILGGSDGGIWLVSYHTIIIHIIGVQSVYQTIVENKNTAN